MTILQVKEQPSQIYRGNFLFYLAKIGLGLLGIVFLTACLGGFILGMVATWRAGNYTVETIGMVLILLITLSNGLLLGITFLHMYPEVGISETHFWFRQFGIWHSIAWSKIEEIRIAKTIFARQGLVVYSNRLPFYYLIFGMAYGRKVGRALFIPAHLSQFSELERQLRQRT